ncbi:MAG TPA: Gfo/Idh/MocA family oxidoreductase [Caldilineaceae bacterium]|nr:Gfo/Idh/MocA family oxidoreductase [Caldilineaceae bacterium]
MNPVKLGVIGCGVIGSRHVAAAAASPHIELTAVADLRSDVAHSIAAQYGVGTVYGPAEELLADPAIEAVVLAMPAHIRTELALKAFAQGKHVLTEKPVAMNANEVRQLLAAKGDRVAACCSSRYHFLTATKTVTDFLATAPLGQVRLVRCRAIVPASRPNPNPPPWRLNRSLNAGGIMSNWGCYDLDYLFGITGWRIQPQRVLAQTWTTPAKLSHYAGPGSDAETHVAALIRCAEGITISYERAEFVAAQADLAWEIIGEEGSLRLQMTPAPGKTHQYFQADATLGTLAGTLCRADEDHGSVHEGPVNDFARAIRSGNAPQTDLQRALVIQAVTDAIYASATSGDAVTVETQ